MEHNGDPAAQHTMRIRVRHHEIDPLGHVNNAVYLNYIEEVAIEHARARGFDAARWRELGGSWVVRRHEIDYRQPALAGDDLDVTTRIVGFDRVRGVRATEIVRAGNGAILARARTEWVWVDHQGRPRRIPAAVSLAFATAPPLEGTEAHGRLPG